MLSSEPLDRFSSSKRQNSTVAPTSGQVGRPLANCDQCRKSRRRCSRTFPKCEMCTKRNHPCTYLEIAKKLKDGKNVYPKTKPSGKNLEVALSNKGFSKAVLNASQKGNIQNFISSRVLYWLQNRGCSVNSTYNPAIVMFATRLNEIPGFLFYLQKTPYPSPTITDSSIELDEDKELSVISFQLIDIYFRNINPYFPMVDEITFRDSIRQSNWSLPLQLLFHTILFVSLGYHPKLHLVQRLWPAIASKTKLLLKKTYLTPSISTVQAYTLLGMQASVSDKDGIYQHAGLYLGLAYKMAILLGLYKLPPFMPQRQKVFRLQVWWGVPILEQLLMHCTGRPPTLTLCDRYVHLRSSVAPSTVSHNDLKTKSSDYHRFIYAYSRLVSRVAVIRKTFQDSVTASIRQVIVDPIGPTSPKPSFTEYVREQQALLSESSRLEAAFHHWFRSYMFGPESDHHVLQASTGDYFTAQIHINYFLALHELNASLRQPSDQNGSTLKFFDFNNPVIDVELFSKCNPTEKCIIVSLLGARTIIHNVGHETFMFHGTNFKWWCAGQFLFTLLELTQNDPTHPAIPSAKEFLDFALRSMKEGCLRWTGLGDFASKAQSIQCVFKSP